VPVKTVMKAQYLVVSTGNLIIHTKWG